MEYVRFGGTGIEVSPLCLGTWMFGTETEDGQVVTDREQAHTILDTAWDNGINFFDTANVYGVGDSERFIGDWLADHERENFILASKVFFDTRGRHDVSLSRKVVKADSKPRWTDWIPTTSISITSTGGTTRPQSRRPSRRWTTSSETGKSTTSA